MNTVTRIHLTPENLIVLEDDSDPDNRIHVFNHLGVGGQTVSHFYPVYRRETVVAGERGTAWFSHLTEGIQGSPLWTNDLNTALAMTRTHSLREEAAAEPKSDTVIGGYYGSDQHGQSMGHYLCAECQGMYRGHYPHLRYERSLYLSDEYALKRRCTHCRLLLLESYERAQPGRGGAYMKGTHTE